MTERLLTENEKYNLTALTDPGKIALLHYADCALIAKYMKKGATVIDVGCGAGFPTLPLAVLRPDLRLLAVDSTEKKVAYVRETARLFGLDNVACLTARAEEIAADGNYRERFDFATARAVTEMRSLAELLLPFVKVGGTFIAYKAAHSADKEDPESELSRSQKALSALGGKLEDVLYYDLCDFYDGEDDDKKHALLVVKKVRPTPQNYPRRYPQILKKPL